MRREVGSADSREPLASPGKVSNWSICTYMYVHHALCTLLSLLSGIHVQWNYGQVFETLKECIIRGKEGESV